MVIYESHWCKHKHYSRSYNKKCHIYFQHIKDCINLEPKATVNKSIDYKNRLKWV